MATVTIHAVASLDGLIARPDDSLGPLFDWYESGDVEVYAGDRGRPFHVSQASADCLAPLWAEMRSMVIGRHLFDITDGWGGVPSVGEHVFVVTHEAPTDWGHPDAPYTFVTTGVEDAVRQASDLAGDGRVAVTPGEVGGQVYAAGLADEVTIDLAPVVLGRGKSFWGSLTGEIVLDDPYVLVQGDGVLHLRHRVPG
jgi:dihydrofolate reductase